MRPRSSGLATSAAVLRRVAADPGLYGELDRRSARLAAGIEEGFRAAGLPGHVRRVGSMLQPFLTARPAVEPRDVGEAAALQPADAYTAYCDELERRGVYAHRYPLGRWFVSLAHDDDAIDETIAAAADAARALA